MPSFSWGSGTCSMQSISYGSKTRPFVGISCRPTSWRAFPRLSRTIRTPSPALPSSATTAASISSTTGRRRERRSSWANFTTVAASRSTRLRYFSNSAWRYFNFVSSSSFWRRSSASSSRGVASVDSGRVASCASSSSCSAGDFSFISGTCPESDAMGTDPTEGHVEDAVPVRDIDRVRLDRLRQFDLAVEHPPFRIQRVDREPVRGGGDLQGLAGRAPEFEGHVDRREVDDDFGEGLPDQTALVGNGRRRPQRGWAHLSHRGEAPVCAEAPDDAVDGAGGWTLPLAGGFRDHGDLRGPRKGPLRNLRLRPHRRRLRRPSRRPGLRPRRTWPR